MHTPKLLKKACIKRHIMTEVLHDSMRRYKRKTYSTTVDRRKDEKKVSLRNKNKINKALNHLNSCSFEKRQKDQTV